MAPNPSESALVASLQARLFHWKTFSTVANTQLEQALHDWFAKDAIATASLRNCTLSAASSAKIDEITLLQCKNQDAKLVPNWGLMTCPLATNLGPNLGQNEQAH